MKEHGYYYVDVSLGTPPKSFQVIVDTGSTLTYVPCVDCGSNCGEHTGAPKFDPDSSETCERVRCGTEDCHDVGGCAAGGSDACEYSKSYAEHSSVHGRLVKDKVHLGGTLDEGDGLDVVFGCTTRETGSIHGQVADGLMGLGNGVDSFPSQLARRYGLTDAFSLCFGAFDGGGAVTFGKVPGFARSVEGDEGARNASAAGASTPSLRYTRLLHNPAHKSYYILKTLEWSLGSARVAGEDDFEVGYGTVLDSGTTFTYVTTPVFENFREVLDKAVLGPDSTRRVDGPDPAYPDDVCYAAVANAPPLTEDSLVDVFPNLTIRFEGDDELTLELPPKNYLFIHGHVADAFCLGVMDNGGAGTLLGGITARDVLVEYDLTGEGRVGMVVADCARLLEEHAPGGANDTVANATGTDDASARAAASSPPPPPPSSPPSPEHRPSASEETTRAR